MITVNELKTWLSKLSDTDEIGIDDGGMCLQTENRRFSIMVGGIPEDSFPPDCPDCGNIIPLCICSTE